MPLIKRITKGTPLTFAEGDANLDYLENLSNNTGSFATTGSNVFYGNQNINGTLFVASQTVTAGAFTAVQNNYVELSMQNASIGPSASGDFVVYGDNGNAFDHYIDMGINGSGLAPDFTYDGAYLGRANDAYLYTVGGNFRIGTATTSSISQSLFLFANPTGTPDLTITGSRIGIQKTGSLNATLDVKGSTIVSGSFSTTDIVVLSRVSSSLNYNNDAAAASAGIPLGGLYRSGSFILIRLV